MKFEEKIDTEIERERERGPQTAKDETGTLGGRGSVDGEARGRSRTVGLGGRGGSESDGGEARSPTVGRLGGRSGEARMNPD